METVGQKQSLLERLMPRYAGNRPLLVYVLCVVASGAGLLAWRFPESAVLSWSFLLWLGFCLAAEFLWLETVSGEGTESMATTFNLGVICLLEPDVAVWVVAGSVLLATRFIQKRDWVRTLFGLGQMTVTALVCSLVFHSLHPAAASLASFGSALTALAITVTGLVYFVVNTFLVAGAVALEKRQAFFTVWRTNWGYRNAVVTSLALFALSPILIISFLSTNFFGVVLFFLPLLIVKNQNREYIHLQRMTDQLVSTERMAAQGEMAASVAHEINNYLGVLGGRAQLIQMKAQRLGDDSMRADAEIIRQQVQRMSTLAKGLYQFSHTEMRVQRFDLAKLILEAIDFVTPQNIFDRVEIVPELDPEVGEVQADPGQLQQVLLNLMKNAAEAMNEADPPCATKRITIRMHKAAHGMVRVEATDSGPGMARAVAQKVFEPHFTTKKTGHGFGLATCFRILQLHGGRLWVESEPGQGATFIMEFPRRMRGLAGADGAPGRSDERDSAGESRGVA